MWNTSHCTDARVGWIYRRRRRFAVVALSGGPLVAPASLWKTFSSATQRRGMSTPSVWRSTEWHATLYSRTDKAGQVLGERRGWLDIDKVFNYWMMIPRPILRLLIAFWFDKRKLYYGKNKGENGPWETKRRQTTCYGKYFFIQTYVIYSNGNGLRKSGKWF